MEITDVKIYPFDTSRIGGRVRAVAEIVIDDQLMIKGIKLVESKHGGLFISFPKKQSSKGKFVDKWTTIETRETFTINETVDATTIAAASDTSTPEMETGRFCMMNQYAAAAVATVIPVCRRLNKSLYQAYSGSL